MVGVVMKNFIDMPINTSGTTMIRHAIQKQIKLIDHLAALDRMLHKKADVGFKLIQLANKKELDIEGVLQLRELLQTIDIQSKIVDHKLMRVYLKMRKATFIFKSILSRTKLPPTNASHARLRKHAPELLEMIHRATAKIKIEATLRNFTRIKIKTMIQRAPRKITFHVKKDANGNIIV